MSGGHYGTGVIVQRVYVRGVFVRGVFVRVVFVLIPSTRMCCGCAGKTTYTHNPTPTQALILLEIQ